MGYLIVPDLATGKWMCLEPCKHTDCAANRRDFINNANCKICGKPLLAGDYFYYVEQGKTDKVHRLCEMEHIARGEK
jgi:hypothetical protein